MSTLQSELGDPGAMSLFSMFIGMRMDKAADGDRVILKGSLCVQDGGVEECVISK